MTNFLKISEAVSLAFHTMGILADQTEGFLSTQDIARELQVSEHHLQKVHQRLVKAGFIKSVRGPKGGFCLNRPAEQITLMDIYQIIEGPLNPYQCLLGRATCDKVGCVLGKLSDDVNSLVVEHFQKITVADLKTTILVPLKTKQ